MLTISIYRLLRFSSLFASFLLFFNCVHIFIVSMVFVYDALTIFDYEKISDISYLPQISKEGLTIIKTELFLKK